MGKRFLNWLEKLNAEQQNYVFFGVMLPLLPTTLLWIFIFVFEGYTIFKFIGDIIVCTYSILCAAFNIYYSERKGKNIVIVALYILFIIFVALVNSLLTNYDSIPGKYKTLFLSVAIIVILIETYRLFKKNLELLADNIDKPMNKEDKNENR